MPRRMRVPSRATAGLRYATDTRPGHHPPPLRARVQLPRRRWRDRPRSRGPRPDPERWPSRLPGPTCGSARGRTATSRQAGATLAAASSTATTRTGTSGAVRTSSIGCSRSPRSCRGSGGAAMRTSPDRGLLAREGPGGGRPPARADADPRRQRRVRAAEPLVRADDDCATGTRGSRARRVRFRFRGKSGTDPRGRASRSPSRWRRPPLPGAARPGAVPVRRRRRRGPRRGIRRRQRATSARRPAATTRPRTSGHGPAPSSPTGPSARSSPAIGERGGEAERRRGDPADRRPARQHAGRRPRQLCPSRGPRGLPRGIDPRGAGRGRRRAGGPRRRAPPPRRRPRSGRSSASGSRTTRRGLRSGRTVAAIRSAKGQARRRIRSRGGRSRSPRHPPRHRSPTSCRASPRSADRPRTSRSPG